MVSCLTNVLLKASTAQSDLGLCSNWVLEEGQGRKLATGEHSPLLRPWVAAGLLDAAQDSLWGRAWPSPSLPQTYHNLFYPPSATSYQVQTLGFLNNYFILRRGSVPYSNSSYVGTHPLVYRASSPPGMTVLTRGSSSLSFLRGQSMVTADTDSGASQPACIDSQL